MQSKRRSYKDIFRFHFGAVVLSLLLFFIPLSQSALDFNAQAAIIPWSPSSGSATDFYWQNGGSDKGLFGSPVLVNGDTLHFTPTDFIAQTVLGKSAITSDRLQVDIFARPGIEILGVDINESGDYGIYTERKVSASAALFLTNLSQSETRSAMFDIEPDMPISPPPFSGDWSGKISIEGLNWTHFRIVLNNNLIATSQLGSTAFIKKTNFDIRIITPNNNIPEPATVAVLTLGGFILPLFGRKTKNS